MPNNPNRIIEIERVFRLLGLDSISERERMTKILESSEPGNEPSYHVYTTGDTKTLQEDEHAKLESNPK